MTHPLFVRLRDAVAHWTRAATQPAGMSDADIVRAAEEILTRRLMERNKTEPVTIENVVQVLRMRLGLLDHEEFHAVWLDAGNRIIAIDCLSVGTVDYSPIIPREVARAAIRHAATGVIFAHNHPSGRARPSEADKRITTVLIETLQLLDVRVHDHVILTSDAVFHFKTEGLI